ncbi:3-phosphoshikimate 1-carboxyvinyltransferase [Bacillus sp. V2I10]|uniref:3-phosphoshikimate 1-carboxyvinyltransferase n=1 Tax=Bacillus sp. V2I10 TaxID=3042276 RepID=UPI0027892CA6|nr:hypothetical protein [Bacillus sp. V2I10]MDQ0860935.1 3-phosphoshikimate 1-carboxyvinyltransferase [Bacillus sp. V2I10]
MENHKFDARARSPWTPLKNVTKVSVSPSKSRIDGSITIPGSKSLTNRALIMSALANGKSKVSGILKSDDSYWCIDSLKKLGVNVDVQNETAYIEGKGGQWDSGNLYIGAAGTIARFLPGALAVSSEGIWEIEASKSMSKRPVSPLIDALRELGAEIKYLRNEGHYPLLIKGQEIFGGEVSLSGSISSQFISGLLIAAPYFKETGKVERYMTSKLYERVVHAFEPVIGLVQALSYPIGIVVMLGGGLFVMIGNREKGFDMIAKAI